MHIYASFGRHISFFSFYFRLFFVFVIFSSVHSDKNQIAMLHSAYSVYGIKRAYFMCFLSVFAFSLAYCTTFEYVSQCIGWQLGEVIAKTIRIHQNNKNHTLVRFRCAKVCMQLWEKSFIFFFFTITCWYSHIFFQYIMFFLLLLWCEYFLLFFDQLSAIMIVAFLSAAHRAPRFNFIFRCCFRIINYYFCKIAFPAMISN